MKALSISALMLLGGICLFTACDDDRDSNPTLQHPDTFTLNTPTYGGQTVDLASSSTLTLTYSQPDYGFPAPATYQAQVSLTGEFTVSADEADAAAEAGDETVVADYSYIEGTTPYVKMDIPAEDLAKQLVRLGGWTEETTPTNQISVYLRMQSTIGSSTTVYSNVVKLTVIPYYIELTAAPIEMWYLIGSCVGDGTWGGVVGTSIVPMSTVEGYNYETSTGKGQLTFTGYLTTDGFKLVRVPGAWDDQWGQGASFGEFVKNNGGSGNITVPVNGYYTITLDTKADKLTIEAADITPTVYSEMLVSGSFNNWGEAAMTPVNTAACMEGHNHIWVYDMNTDGLGTDEKSGLVEMKFLQSGWSPNWGADLFPYGVGVNAGPNIKVEEGHWTVIFNDIDGSYQFIAVE